MVKVTWQKKNGEIIERNERYIAFYKIGQENAWGWKVINIQKLYKNKYIPADEYDRLVERKWRIERKIKNFINTFLKLYRELGYTLILIIIIRNADKFF